MGDPECGEDSWSTSHGLLALPKLVYEIYCSRWQMLIRPPRESYALSDLGPELFHIGDEAFEREDLQLVNGRGHTLECSHYRPCPLEGTLIPRLPCVIYLHGMGSSRLEVFQSLSTLLTRGMTVFCFDFAGCGKSGGEYISLGHFEEQDVQVVVRHLRRSEHVGAIGLWGRSMGAVSAVLRAAADPSLAACVLDSGYSRLTDVIYEMVEEIERSVVGPWVPGLITRMIIRNLRSEVRSRADFDIEDVVPVREALRCTVPALIVTGLDDDIVPRHHSLELHDAWGCPEKTLATVGGGHNTKRPQEFLDYAAGFLRAKLEESERQRRAGRRPRRTVQL